MHPNSDPYKTNMKEMHTVSNLREGETFSIQNSKPRGLSEKRNGKT